jgi:hypothetical protein
MRYNNTKILKKDKKTIYSTTFYPKIPLKDSDEYVRFPRGMRLDNIAFKYYGTIKYWWIIALANGMKGPEIQIDPTKQYRIPINIQSVLRDFAKLNSSST